VQSPPTTKRALLALFPSRRACKLNPPLPDRSAGFSLRGQTARALIVADPSSLFSDVSLKILDEEKPCLFRWEIPQRMGYVNDAMAKPSHIVEFLNGFPPIRRDRRVHE